MTLFLQCCGLALLSSILILCFHKNGKEYGVLLTILASSMVLLACLNYYSSILSFIDSLKTLSNLDDRFIEILLKTTGIAIVSEIASLICKDAGNSSLGKSIQLLGLFVIIWINIPLFTEFLNLIQRILGGL